MPTLITPTTELEAVNECLENIGQAPVSTISGNLGVDTQIALNFVTKVNRELQAKGWFWNTEVNYPLTPNDDGDILLPANTLAVDSVGVDVHRNVIQRGQRLYDRDNRTYTFASPVNAEITLGLSFNELPETARRYVALRAARFFQDRIEGSSSETDSRDEMDALSDLKAEQLRVEDHNVLTGSSLVYGIVNRRHTTYPTY